MEVLGSSQSKSYFNREQTQIPQNPNESDSDYSFNNSTNSRANLGNLHLDKEERGKEKFMIQSQSMTSLNYHQQTQSSFSQKVNLQILNRQRNQSVIKTKKAKDTYEDEFKNLLEGK